MTTFSSTVGFCPMGFFYQSQEFWRWTSANITLHCATVCSSVCLLFSSSAPKDNSQQCPGAQILPLALHLFLSFHAGFHLLFWMQACKNLTEMRWEKTSSFKVYRQTTACKDSSYRQGHREQSQEWWPARVWLILFFIDSSSGKASSPSELWTNKSVKNKGERHHCLC